MNKKIYFVRHGKSLGNVENTLYEHAESELHEDGKAQAEKVIDRLAHLEFDLIVSSDFVRARQTAETITAVSKQEITFNTLFRERTEGESVADFKQRVLIGKNYLETLQVKRVLVIGHGQWVRMLVACLLYNDEPTEDEYRFAHDFFRIVNTGVCVFNHNTEGQYMGWQLKSWNEHGHLE